MTSAPCRTFTVPDRAVSFRPLNDYVLVKVIRTPERKIRGIHLPEGCEADQWVWHGIVVALGPGDRIKAWENIQRCDRCGSEFAWPSKLRSEGPPCCGMAANSVIERRQKRHAIDLNIGDHILFSYDKRFAVTIDGEEFYCVHEEQHVLAVLSDPIDYAEFGMFSKN